MRAGSWALSSSWQVTHSRTITAEQWDWCLVSWQSHYNWDKELTIVFLSLSVSAGDCAHCQRDNHWFSITCEELTPGRWSGGWRVMVVPAQSDLLCNTGHWHGPQSSVRLDANIASPSSTVERSVSITYHKIPPLSWHLSSDCEGRERGGACFPWWLPNYIHM